VGESSGFHVTQCDSAASFVCCDVVVVYLGYRY